MIGFNLFYANFFRSNEDLTKLFTRAFSLSRPLGFHEGIALETKQVIPQTEAPFMSKHYALLRNHFAKNEYKSLKN